MNDPAAQKREGTQSTSGGSASFWCVQLELARRDHKDWTQEATACVERYKREKKAATARKNTGRRYNVFFSNVETVKSALYGRTAKPDVRRRFADRDPLARQAAEVVERSLIYCAETYDIDKPLEAALHDQQVTGRGVVRIEYEPVIKTRPALDPMTGMPAIGPDGQPVLEEFVAEQKLRERYVYWGDYLQSPARNWDDVWWIAFRHTMTLDQMRKNGFESPETIPLNWSPNMDGRKDVPTEFKKAEVWEVWDSRDRRRLWIVEGHPRPARVDEDPYGLEQFFPLPEPVRDVDDTETLVPTTPLSLYKDQADDLDDITARISRLTKALRRAGVYDQSVKELKRLARAQDNEFIPVENYKALSEKGGLQAAFQTEDISAIAEVLVRLYEQRNLLVQQIYELTGISDILRGSTDPNETLGAQNLKAQFGSQRMKRRQRAVQKWISELLKLKAEIIAEHFEPEALAEMTNTDVTPEVVQLLRSDKLRSYRIEVETDSTIFEDAENEKKARVEVIQAVTGLLQQAVPAVQQAPELGELVFELLGFGLRGFKAGRELEDTVERTGEAIRQKIAAASMQPPGPPAPGAPGPGPGAAPGGPPAGPVPAEAMPPPQGAPAPEAAQPPAPSNEELAGAIMALVQTLNRPKAVMRGPDGRVVGIQ